MPQVPALAGFKPLNLGWQGKCSTTVNPSCQLIFPAVSLFYASGSSIGCILTLELGMTRQVFNHCSPRLAADPFSSFAILCLWCHHWLDSNSWTWDEKASVLPLFTNPGSWSFLLLFFAILCLWCQHCLDWNPSTWDDKASVLPLLAKVYSWSFHLFWYFVLLVQALAGFKPPNLRWWDECFTSVHQSCQLIAPAVLLFYASGASIGWIQTLELGMTRQVFYHC
jgi:hypothetical protein